MFNMCTFSSVHNSSISYLCFYGKTEKKIKKMKGSTCELSQLRTTSKTKINFQERLRLPKDTSSGNVELLNPRDEFEIKKTWSKHRLHCDFET